MAKCAVGLTRRLAEAATAPVQATPAQLERARLLLFDYMAVRERGERAESSVAARAALSDATDVRTRALLDAMAGHAIELDDTHEPASLHPGVVVWPVVLALAPLREAGEQAALDAAIVGYGVMCHVGRALGGATAYARGFHPTGVAGVFGAAAAAGRLLGLDTAAMQNALGIAATGASGSMEYLSDGAWTKRLNPGLAASNGILAAQLAQRGFQGPSTGLEGAFGFLHAYGDTDSVARANDEIDIAAGLLETSVKLYPCCRYMHGCIDLLIDIATEHDLAADDIERVECGVLSGGSALVAEPIAAKRAVASQVDAQFSMPFGAAVALTYRRATLEEFENAPDVAERLRPLMARVDCYSSPSIDEGYPDRWAAEVIVRTRSGATYRRGAPGMRGSPAFPADWSQVASKAAGLLGEERARALLDRSRRFGGAPLAGGSSAR